MLRLLLSRPPRPPLGRRHARAPCVRRRPAYRNKPTGAAYHMRIPLQVQRDGERRDCSSYMTHRCVTPRHATLHCVTSSSRSSATASAAARTGPLPATRRPPSTSQRARERARARASERATERAHARAHARVACVYVCVWSTHLPPSRVFPATPYRPLDSGPATVSPVAVLTRGGDTTRRTPQTDTGRGS